MSDTRVQSTAVTDTVCPRIVVAGTGGDSGKTLVTMGLIWALRRRGIRPLPFKKGPDYIDAAWLSWAADTPCRNLDTYLQPNDRITTQLARFGGGDPGAVAVVEGNRGLHDGMDLAGTHSTASLARLIGAPVVLVVSAAKVTRTVAAVVLGCQQLEPDVPLAGVILNRVGGPRHRAIVRQAVEQTCGIPVLGALPRLKNNPLPDRHLGLVTPEEHPGLEGVEDRLADFVSQHLDLDRLVELARGAFPVVQPLVNKEENDKSHGEMAGRGAVKIGVFSDSAFTFYYPENLEALEQAGAELVRISGLADGHLPDVHALYLGGGFPETHAHKLADNHGLLADVRRVAEAGMPIYAECGGMIYLCRSLTCHGRTHAMANVLPMDLALFARPQGHGYVELEVDRPNPFFEVGQTVRGHEFHYTKVTAGGEDLHTAFAVRRGTGTFDLRDGVVYKNVVAGYTHLHALGTVEWASGLVRRAAEFRDLG